MIFLDAVSNSRTAVLFMGVTRANIKIPAIKLGCIRENEQIMSLLDAI